MDPTFPIATPVAEEVEHKLAVVRREHEKTGGLKNIIAMPNITAARFGSTTGKTAMLCAERARFTPQLAMQQSAETLLVLPVAMPAGMTESDLQRRLPEINAALQQYAPIGEEPSLACVDQKSGEQLRSWQAELGGGAHFAGVFRSTRAAPKEGDDPHTRYYIAVYTGAGRAASQLYTELLKPLSARREATVGEAMATPALKTVCQMAQANARILAARLATSAGLYIDDSLQYRAAYVNAEAAESHPFMAAGGHLQQTNVMSPVSAFETRAMLMDGEPVEQLHERQMLFMEHQYTPTIGAFYGTTQVAGASDYHSSSGSSEAYVLVSPTEGLVRLTGCLAAVGHSLPFATGSARTVSATAADASAVELPARIFVAEGLVAGEVMRAPAYREFVKEDLILPLLAHPEQVHVERLRPVAVKIANRKLQRQ